MVDSPHDRVWECTVTDAESRSDAKAASTCVVPRGQKASGRQSHSALAARIQRSRLASQMGFRALLENIAAVRRYWSQNTSRRDATELSLLSSHPGDRTRTRNSQVYSTGRVPVGSREVRATAVRGLRCPPSLLHVRMLCLYDGAGCQRAGG
jgi:hypothetical protein